MYYVLISGLDKCAAIFASNTVQAYEKALKRYGANRVYSSCIRIR